MKNKIAITMMLGALTLAPAAFAQTSSQTSTMQEQSAAHDPKYLDMMTEHHKGGIKMAEMASKKAESKEVKNMAEKLVKDQKKELKQMQEWREQKFASAPKSEQMPPKMDMSKLENSTGKEFDTNFAMMMAQHHEEGIKMTEEAIPKLQNNQIKEFAQSTTKNQTKEMKELHNLHSSLEKNTSKGTGSQED